MDNWILFAIIAGVLVIMIPLFNALISRKNQVEFAFASIDAQFKKRYDLIPKLMSACEKYMGYEQNLLKELTETRSRYLQAGEDEKVDLDKKLSNQLRSVFAVAENYPDLKAANNFINLQRALNEVEEQLAASRRAFNAAVMQYNNAVEQFPTSVVALLMGYKRRASFEATAEEREPVKVWR